MHIRGYCLFFYLAKTWKICNFIYKKIFIREKKIFLCVSYRVKKSKCRASLSKMIQKKSRAKKL